MEHQSLSSDDDNPIANSVVVGLQHQKVGMIAQAHAILDGLVPINSGHTNKAQRKTSNITAQ